MRWFRRKPVPPLVPDEPDAERVILVEKTRRRDVLGRLRELVDDARAVESLIVDDYARADREQRG